MCLPPSRHLSLRCGHRQGALRHTVEHIIDVLPYVQMLDVRGPQMGNQLVMIDTRTPVPKMFHSVLWSVVFRRRRNSWWKYPRSCPSLLYSSGLPSRSLTLQLQVVVVGGVRGGLQGLRPGQNSTAFSGAEHVDIPVHLGRGGVGGLQGLRLSQVSSPSSSHSPGASDEVFTEFFSHFSTKIKKWEVGSALGVGTECGLYFIHAVGSATNIKKKCEVSRESESEGARELELMDAGGLKAVHASTLGHRHLE